MRSKYFMASEQDGTLEILIYGDITSWEWDESDVSSYNLAQVIGKSDAGRIHVKINSYGGEVSEGLAIYNSLKNHPAYVETVCDGFACSAASIVFMAGDDRVMNDASLMMIHHAWTYARGNAQDLRKAAEDLEKISNTAAEAYRRVMAIDEEKLQELLENESWITPQEAFTYGFATAVEGEGEAGQPLYSVRKKVFEQLTAEKQIPSAVADTGFTKMFRNFGKKEGE